MAGIMMNGIRIIRSLRWALITLVGWAACVLMLAAARAVSGDTLVLLLAYAPILAGLVYLLQTQRSSARAFNAALVRLTESSQKSAKDLALTRKELEALAAKTVGRPALEKALKETASDVVSRTRRGVAADLLTTYRQLEALQNLYAVIKIDRPMPQTRTWACSPDLLLLLMGLVERERPSLIVECGSGTSTLWFGLTLRRFEIKGRVVALEHQKEFVEVLCDSVGRHGLEDFIEVRYAPLEPMQVTGQELPWYARAAWEDLEAIDLLFVDGPPSRPDEHARLPALPMLVDRLHPDAVVVLDDMIRTDEQEVLEQWLATYPEFSAEHVRLEKNAAILRRGLA
jgi:predicted O-methyltransferase YrrM